MKNNSLRNVFKSYILLTFDTAIFYQYFFFTLYRLSKIYKCCCCFHFYEIVLILLLPFQIVWRVKSLLSVMELAYHFSKMEQQRSRRKGRKRELRDEFIAWSGWVHSGRGNTEGC